MTVNLSFKYKEILPNYSVACYCENTKTPWVSLFLFLTFYFVLGYSQLTKLWELQVNNRYSIYWNIVNFMEQKSNLAYFIYKVNVDTTTLVISTVKHFWSRENTNRFFFFAKLIRLLSKLFLCEHGHKAYFFPELH